MIRASIIYTAAALVSQLAAFLLLPVMSRNLSQQDFGLVSILEAELAIVAALSTLSIEKSAKRFYFDFPDDTGKDVFRLALIVCLFAGIAIVAIVSAITFTIFDAPRNIYFSLICVSGVFLGLNGVGCVYAQVQDKPLFQLVSNFVKGVILLSFGFIGMQVLALGVLGYVLAVSFTYMALGILAIQVLPRVNSFDINHQLVRQMIRYAAPFIPSALAAWAITMGGRFVLERFSSLAEVGHYAFWFKVSLVYFFATGSVNTAITPLVHRYLSGRDSNEGTLRTVLFVPIQKIYFISAMALLLISKDLGEVLGGDRFQFSPVLMSFILATHYISSSIGASSDLLFYHSKNTVAHMLIFIVGGMTSLVLCWIITRWFGAQGVSLASMLGLVLIVLLHALIFHYQKKVRFGFRWIATFSICLLLTGGLLEWVQLNSEDVRFVRWMVAGGLVIFAAYKFFATSKSFSGVALCGATP